MKVKNMISERSGREVANQFIITDENKVYFQSYSSLIAEIDSSYSAVLKLGRDWDYSRTTMKYLNQFIRENLSGYFRHNNLDISASGIRKGIATGIIRYDERMA